MTTLKNEAVVLFNGRSYAYELFQIIFDTEPDEKLLEILADGATAEALSLFDDGETQGYGDALEAFTQAPVPLEDLRREYMNVLIGPAKLPAPPWESVYVTEERLLFQKNTLDVRNAYIAFGVLPAEYPHVPDDHISYELAFMTRLNKVARNAYIAGDRKEMKCALDASEAFLKKHLSAWIPSFAAQMKKAAGAVFYPAAADMLARFLAADKSALAELAEI